MGINFEYNARNTPQQIGLVEQNFAPLWGMVRAMVRCCELNKRKRLQNKLWEECANMETQLINIMVDKAEDSCGYKKFHNAMPPWCKIPQLHAFGQMCMVTKRNKIIGKLNECGGLGFMTGYSEKHSAGNYCSKQGLFPSKLYK